MKRSLCLTLALFLAAMLAGCGSGYNNPSTGNNGLFGSWNIVMYPNGTQNPVYVFALALSQLGTSNYSGSSITYTGSVPAPSNMCISANALRASATVNGSNFTMTVTDTTTSTIITVNGTLGTTNQSISGNYTNPASESCTASSGTVSMVAQ